MDNLLVSLSEIRYSESDTREITFSNKQIAGIDGILARFIAIALWEKLFSLLS
ncbi:hypothetical protein [Nostoc sp. PA-18-2419]|uniref:hypothetical protein n=1 Tax=Nostoc sp. PA-18-2419 TaxID=2575443 RepID=UPI0016788CC6|nr:hypothetical protein [Nostoc sp. PA-18-2419]